MVQERSEKAKLVAASSQGGQTAVALAAAASRELPERIAGYRIVNQIYRGRVHLILRARTEGIGGVERSVVVKLIRPPLAHNGRFIRSFLHEERVTGTLNHPSVIQLLDSGDSEYGYYMVFEHIQGYNLTEIMAAAAGAKIRMPLEVAVTIAHGVANGLRHVHELSTPGGKHLGLVHRNIRPSNIVVREDGFVKLIDFGEVAIAGMEREPSPLEDRMHSYTPPEMVREDPVDRRGDLYSLGAILYELTTGRLPLENLALANGDLSGKITPPSRIVTDYWPELETVVMKLLDADPNERIVSAADLAQALEELALEHKLSISAERVARYTREVFAAPPSSDQSAQAGAANLSSKRRQSTNMGKTRIRVSRRRESTEE